jgi:hypothetical protein
MFVELVKAAGEKLLSNQRQQAQKKEQERKQDRGYSR